METVKVVDDKNLLITKVKEYYVQVYKSHRRKKFMKVACQETLIFKILYCIIETLRKIFRYGGN